MSFRFCVALGAAAVLALAGTAVAQQPIVIKFSHVVALDTPKGKGAEYFKKLAEERTKGRVKVEVYPNSQLYKDGEEMEALQLGSVQMLAPSVAKFGPLGAREFEVFDLPYIFDSFAELHKITEGSVGKQLFQKLEFSREFIVVKTFTAGAQPIAEAIDAEGNPDILGTIAGENTVLIICRTETARERVAQRLLALAGR